VMLKNEELVRLRNINCATKKFISEFIERVNGDDSGGVFLTDTSDYQRGVNRWMVARYLSECDDVDESDSYLK
jgi:hypothetical protein